MRWLGDRLPFVVRLALREGRSGVRRVGIFMASITLGVAALVSIHSFRDDVAHSVQEQAESLLGANVRISMDRPFPDSVSRVVDSLRSTGVETASVTTTASMVLAPRTDRVRLLQVRAVDGSYPFYGTPTTSPPGLWGAHLEAGRALVDPPVLAQLGVVPGDTLAVGRARVVIAAAVEGLPVDPGFQAAVGPRVWVSGESVRDAGLLGLGSLARHEIFLRMPEAVDREALASRYDTLFQATRADMDTAEGRARRLSRAVGFLGRYLGLVGLGALLLGGIGVASAVHVYVREKLTGVAVLRCMGARQWDVFLAYLLEAGVLGLAGAAAGAALGVAVQQALPSLLGAALPVEVVPRLSFPTVFMGLLVGSGVALLFALGPLLVVRDVPPLRALRRDFEDDERSPLDRWRLGTYGLLAASVLGLSVLEAPAVPDGVVFALALAVAVGVLWLMAVALIRGAGRHVPAGAPYTVRQGVSNLFRPRNQTVAVMLALGFGVFILGTVTQLQSSLGSRLSLDAGSGRPNLLLFDVQADQVEGVLELLPAAARPGASVTPIVPSRLRTIRGRTPEELRADTGVAREERPERWALHREYRHTFRPDLSDAEELVAGRWFDDLPLQGEGEGEGLGTEARPARASMEIELADELGIGLGDRVTWDVAGREVVSVVTSFRRVDWSRFSTNFFVVFEPGSLDDAPRTTVILARVPDDASRALVQRALVEDFPNVSALDLTRLQETVESILGQVDGAVRFLALFTGLAGLLVLAGALAASRHQRIRESALLRTLGARRSQVLSVVLTEYLVLGGLAALAGLGLGAVAAWAVARWMMDIPFVPSPGAAALLWLGVTLLTALVGLLGSRGVLRRPPLPALRAAE